MEPLKRDLRELKRQLKHKGGKRRRADLKRQLQRDPESAHACDPAAFDFGRASSAHYNGLDRDATRRRSEGELRP